MTILAEVRSVEPSTSGLDIRQTIAALRAGGDEAVIAAAEAIAPAIAERADYHDRTGIFPTRNFEELWASGLTSLSLPASAGGVGASLYATSRALGLVAKADGSTAFLLKWHLTRFRDAASKWPEPVRSDVLREILSGPALIAGLRVEPELGSPARGGTPGTRAKLVVGPNGEKKWRISGHKIYGSGSVAVRWFAVWGATLEEDGPVRVGSFLVPAGTPGVEIIEGSWDQIGMRATASNDIVFHDVEIPYENAIGLLPFQGADPLSARRKESAVADWGSVLEASLYAGIADATRDWLVVYLNKRAPASLGAPLSHLERFQLAVGEIELLTYANRQLIDSVSRRIDAQSAGETSLEQEVTGNETAMVKVAAVRNAIAAVDLAVSLVGNPGLAYRHPVQRYYRDVLHGRVHEPQADTILLATGRQALGLGA
ncbi:MAG: acyl-CoA dehydrogenase [Methylocystaceae bacterium]|nr:MAG: acyl-CoA dehydrogenase [Methylocystaceae bacterium]